MALLELRYQIGVIEPSPSDLTMALTQQSLARALPSKRVAAVKARHRHGSRSRRCRARSEGGADGVPFVLAVSSLGSSEGEQGRS